MTVVRKQQLRKLILVKSMRRYLHEFCILAFQSSHIMYLYEVLQLKFLL